MSAGQMHSASRRRCLNRGESRLDDSYFSINYFDFIFLIQHTLQNWSHSTNQRGKQAFTDHSHCITIAASHKCVASCQSNRTFCTCYISTATKQNETSARGKPYFCAAMCQCVLGQFALSTELDENRPAGRVYVCPVAICFCHSV